MDKMSHFGPSENDTDREWFVNISNIFERWLDKIRNENNSMKESIMKDNIFGISSSDHVFH